MRCRIWMCDWDHDDDGFLEAWLEHRRIEHPTADRVAQARLGREPKAAETLRAAAASLGDARAHVTPTMLPSPRPVSAEPGSRPAPHCRYCGQELARGEVCGSHSDLPAFERAPRIRVAA